jgi:hypothetical protein
MRWSEEQLAEHQARVGKDTAHPPFKMPANEAGALARGRLPGTTMNKTEAAYAAHLEARKARGDVLGWWYEAIKFKLADNTFYTPDFMVLLADMSIDIDETKGFWRDDARVKIKVAAAMFPFRFRAITKGKGGLWNIEEISR